MKNIMSWSSLLFLTILFFFTNPTFARKRHVINFRSTNLYPEGLTWDPFSQHFVVGSFHHRSLLAISDAGVVETLITDTNLPPNVTILGLAIDTVNRRLLAAITAIEPLPPFTALAAYDLRTRKRIFLSHLTDTTTTTAYRQIANGVTVDFNGNSYVTNSASNFIWKVNSEGEASVFSKSPAFVAHPVDPELPYSSCGLNGIVYSSKGYFLVVQSNTGKLFKVDSETGKARLVSLPKDLMAADGIAVRRDGVVVVMSQSKAWLLKSQNSWGDGVIYDEIELDVGRFPTSVTIREDNRESRMYVVYGHVDEGALGKVERDEFAIEEIESKKDNQEENIWIFVLLGLGLAYFMYWRFQMGQLVKNMNKKVA